MKKQAVIIFSSISLLTAGCTEPGKTTGYATAAGGAIGAGLGAIVGSQVGSAGAGLAIGAAAGAGAGAAIGNALEANEKKTLAHDERLNRQDELLRAQKNEIASLRNVDHDTYPKSSSSSGTHFNGSFASAGSGDGGGSGGVRYASASEIAAAKNRMETRDSSMNGRAQLNSSYLRAPSGSNTPAYQPASLPSSTSTEVIAPTLPNDSIRGTNRGGSMRDGSVTEKNLIDTPVSAISGNGSEITSGASHERDVEHAPTSNSIIDTTASLQNSKQTECSNGDEEMLKADQATDSADKLFHIRRALRLCPTTGKFHVRLSELYSTLNRKEDAIFEAKEAVRLDPSDAGAAATLISLQKSSSNSAAGTIASAKEPKLPGSGRY